MTKLKIFLIISSFCTISYINVWLIGDKIISSINDDLLKIQLNLSFITAFLGPFSAILFLFITIKFMLFYYDIKIKGMTVLDLITDSFIPTCKVSQHC